MVREGLFNTCVHLESWKVNKHSLDTQIKESSFKKKAGNTCLITWRFYLNTDSDSAGLG